MTTRDHPTTVLTVWASAVAIGSVGIYGPMMDESVGGLLALLTIVIGLVVGCGLFLTALQILRQRVESVQQSRTPSSIVLVVGTIGIVGGPLVTTPWQYEGLAGALRAIGLVGFEISGIVFVTAGAYWWRARNAKYPLLVLAGLTGVGAVYPLDDMGILRGLNPLLYAAIILIFIAIPILFANRQF